MCDIFERSCENKTCRETTRRIIEIIFCTIGNILIMLGNNGKEGEQLYLVITCYMVVIFFIIYYIFFGIMKCCENYNCKSKNCIYLTLFIYSLLYILLDLISIILSIVAMGKSKKDIYDSEPYTVKESEYKSFLAINIIGIIFIIIGFYCISIDLKNIEEKISCSCCHNNHKNNVIQNNINNDNNNNDYNNNNNNHNYNNSESIPEIITQQVILVERNNVNN